MVSGIITAADFSNFEPKLLAAARYTLQHKTLMPELFERVMLEPHMGRTYNVPKHGTVTATSLTEGVPIGVGQIPTQGNTAITPGEKGEMVVLTDVAIASGRDNYMTQMGRVLGDVIVKLTDQDGLAKFSDYTTIGTAGSAIVMTLGHLNAGIARVRASSEAAPGPFWYVTRPETMRIVLNGVTGATATYPTPAGISEEVLQLYFRHDFRLYGLNGGFDTANLAKGASNANEAVGAVFSKFAHIFVEAHPPQFESERDPTLRGYLEVCTARYAYGSYQTSWGCGMTFDAATPVS